MYKLTITGYVNKDIFQFCLVIFLSVNKTKKRTIGDRPIFIINVIRLAFLVYFSMSLQLKSKLHSVIRKINYFSQFSYFIFEVLRCLNTKFKTYIVDNYFLIFSSL